MRLVGGYLLRKDVLVHFIYAFHIARFILCLFKVIQAMDPLIILSRVEIQVSGGRRIIVPWIITISSHPSIVFHC